MTSINLCLTSHEIEILRSMVGKKLVSIQHDKFRYTNTSLEAVALHLEDATYYLYSLTEVMDFYGDTEEVARWSLQAGKKDFIDAKDWIVSPIDETIRDIRLVQEHQEVFDGEEQTDDVLVTRGLIFDLGDRELSFEKAAWFSEDIYIQKGQNLISTFTRTSDFEEDDWPDGLTAKCTRSILTLA